MIDIVEWLRAYANRTTVIDIKRLDDAADEIECLRAGRSEQVLELKNHIDQQYAEIVRFQSQIKRLKTALQDIADYNTEVAYERDGEMDWDIWRNMKQYARAALEGK